MKQRPKIPTNVVAAVQHQQRRQQANHEKQIHQQNIGNEFGEVNEKSYNNKTQTSQPLQWN